MPVPGGGGVPVPGGRGVPVPGGGSAPGGCLLPWGVCSGAGCLLWGGCLFRGKRRLLLRTVRILMECILVQTALLFQDDHNKIVKLLYWSKVTIAHFFK